VADWSSLQPGINRQGTASTGRRTEQQSANIVLY